MDKDHQALMLEAYSLKGIFIQLSHDLDECWEEAKKIKDFSQRLEAYRMIFKTHDKILDLLRVTINAIRRQNETI